MCGESDLNLLHFLQVKKNYEALRQREEEERMVHSSPSRGGEGSQSTSKWEKESHEATRELLKVKDRLIEVERNVSDYCWSTDTYSVHPVDEIKGAVSDFSAHLALCGLQ